MSTAFSEGSLFCPSNRFKWQIILMAIKTGVKIGSFFSVVERLFAWVLTAVFSVVPMSFPWQSGVTIFSPDTNLKNPSSIRTSENVKHLRGQDNIFKAVQLSANAKAASSSETEGWKTSHSSSQHAIRLFMWTAGVSKSSRWVSANISKPLFSLRMISTRSINWYLFAGVLVVLNAFQRIRGTSK